MQPRITLLALALGLLPACGGAPARSKSSPDVARATPATAVEPPPAPGHVRRRDVIATLSAGPGAFLQRVDVEPVLAGRRFRGWRIAALRGAPGSWAGVDLKSGDVVTRVNGYPIERPEQVMAPWQSLAIASDLRVSYERDGKARELRLQIDDDPSAPSSAPAASAQR